MATFPSTLHVFQDNSCTYVTCIKCHKTRAKYKLSDLSLGPVHYTGEIWKRKVLLWTRKKCFRSHYARGIWKRNNHRSFWICVKLKKTRAGTSRDYRDVIVPENPRFQDVFRPHENENMAFSNSSGLKSVLEKLRFRDGLVWTEGLTVGKNLRFQISPALCGWTRPKLWDLFLVNLLIEESFSKSNFRSFYFH